MGLQEIPIQEQWEGCSGQVATDPMRRCWGELMYYRRRKKSIACNALYRQRSVFTAFSGLSSQSKQSCNPNLQLLLLLQHKSVSMHADGPADCPYCTDCNKQRLGTNRYEMCCRFEPCGKPGPGEWCWHTGIACRTGMAGQAL